MDKSRQRDSAPAAVAAPWPTARRLLAYSVATASAFQAVVWAAGAGYAAALGSEYGPLEYAHFSLAAAAAALLLAAARVARRMPTVLTACSLVAWFAVARESDRFLADLAFSDANKLVMTAIALAAAAVLARGRGSIGAELSLFVRTPAFHFLFFGWLVVVVYAQITGQQELWQSVMGDSYIRLVKNTLEELAELLGYLLLLFGALEAYVLERASARR